MKNKRCLGSVEAEVGKQLAPPLEGALGSAPLSNRAHGPSRTQVSRGQSVLGRTLCPLPPVQSLYPVLASVPSVSHFSAPPPVPITICC